MIQRLSHLLVYSEDKWRILSQQQTDFTASFELRVGMERSVVLCCVVLVFYYVVLLWTDQLKVINEMNEKIILLSDTLDKAKQSIQSAPFSGIPGWIAATGSDVRCGGVVCYAVCTSDLRPQTSALSPQT